MRYAVALGFFDGVHIGHAALVRRTAALAKRLGLEPAVCTFDRSPASALGRSGVKLINSLPDRLSLLRSLGIEHIFVLDFDDRLRSTEPEDFVSLLASKYDAGALCCGWNYRFGTGGRGDCELLRRECARLGLSFDMQPAVDAGGSAVSSTRIRALLESGDAEAAHKLLGHPHVLTGEVLHGNALGRTLGFPTANLRVPDGVLAPRYGVYAVRVRLGRETFHGIANVGEKPTVGNYAAGVETNIFDFDRDIYGEEMTVEFLRFVRPERKFSGLDKLQAQVLADREAVRRGLERE